MAAADSTVTVACSPAPSLRKPRFLWLPRFRLNARGQHAGPGVVGDGSREQAEVFGQVGRLRCQGPGLVDAVDAQAHHLLKIRARVRTRLHAQAARMCEVLRSTCTSSISLSTTCTPRKAEETAARCERRRTD